jgi:hypothetical protein
MGTRNSTLIQVDGEYKVAQYCQWDGYPSGQGVGILESLRNSNLQKLRENVSSLESISCLLYTSDAADDQSTV